MIEELNNKLLEEGYETEIDFDGIYVPKYKTV